MSDLLGKLDTLRKSRQRLQAENRRKLEMMGLIGPLEELKEAFGEVRLEWAVSREAPFFVGDRDRCRRLWRRYFQ